MFLNSSCFFFLALLILLINSCTTTVYQDPEYSRKYNFENDGADSHSDIDPAKVKQALPKNEAKSRYGNPQSYTVYGKKYNVLASAKAYKQQGGASWYGKKFHGARTSSGEAYDMYAMTAAHKTLPLPSYVKVTNLDNHKTVIVRVNDRGPFHPGRIIDLSYSAAYQLGIVAKGSARVEVQAIDPNNWKSGEIDKTKDIEQTAEQKAEKQITKKDDHQAINALMAKSFIQIGAFVDIKNTQTLVDKLENSFNEPILVIKKRSQEQWLQVIKMGPFSSQNRLNTSLEKLIKLGFKSSRQVQ